MNSEIRKIILSRDIHPIFYEKKRNVYIIKDKKNGYVIKLNTNNYDIYKYLLSRDFIYYPENFTRKNDNYDIYEYIPDIKEDKYQKLEDLIVIISILHKKTSYIREICLDDIEDLYENIIKNINNARDFYLKLNDEIDKEIFLSPSHYLLIRNISLIYYSLEEAQRMINEWYRLIRNEKNIRVALLHNNVSLEHLIINEEKYLISWDKSYFDNPIYDLENLYRKYYKYIEFKDVIKIYEKNNKLNDLEYQLLIILMLIPKHITFTKNTLDDTNNINNELIFLNKIIEIVKKDNLNNFKKFSKN